MFLWDFDENDAYPVRISDPHLQQPPRLKPGSPDDLDPGRLQTLMLGREMPDLQPQRDIASGGSIPDAGHFQVAATEEEDEPGIVAVTELAVDGETEGVSVETATAVRVGRPEQDPAAEYVHTPDDAAGGSLPAERDLVGLGDRVRLDGSQSLAETLARLP